MEIYLCGPPISSGIDWYGHFSLLFHFAGCNFNCNYCQNHEFIDIRNGTSFIQKEVEKWLVINSIMHDHMVITGGEPTMQPEALEWVAKTAVKYGYKVMLDTNGTQTTQIIQLIRKGYIHRVALDVKAPIDNHESYPEVIGDRNIFAADAVIATMKEVKNEGAELEIRTTVVEGTVCSKEHLFEIAKSVKDYADEYHIQQFNAEHGYKWADKEEPDFGELVEIGHAIHIAYSMPVVVKRNTGERVEFGFN